MRRIHLVIIGIIVVICVVALYVSIARPTLTLPTVTVALAEGSPVAAIQQQMNVKELNVVVRTDGKVMVNADGQQLAGLSYNLVSLNNTSNLAQQVAMPPSARIAIRIFPFLFPGLASNVYLTGLSAYYVLPVEITIRFVRG